MKSESVNLIESEGGLVSGCERMGTECGGK